MKKLLLVGLLISSFVSQYAQAKRVYVDMIADLFHAGHIEFFKKALKHGDYLIVGLIGDEVATGYKRLPILTLSERMAAVSACRYVDEVIGDAPLYLTDEFLDEHKIDVVIHGDDYDQETIEAFYGPALKRGIFKTVPYTPGISTSEIIRRIVSRFAKAAG